MADDISIMSIIATIAFITLYLPSTVERRSDSRDADIWMWVSRIADVFAVLGFIILILGFIWVFLRPYPEVIIEPGGMLTLDNYTGATLHHFSWTYLVTDSFDDIEGKWAAINSLESLPYGERLRLKLARRGTEDESTIDSDVIEDHIIYIMPEEYLFVVYSWQNPVLPSMRMRRSVLLSPETRNLTTKTSWFRRGIYSYIAKHNKRK